MGIARLCAAGAALALGAGLLSGCSPTWETYGGYDYATSYSYGYAPPAYVREQRTSGPNFIQLFFAALLTDCDDDDDVFVINDFGGGGGRKHGKGGGWKKGGGGGGRGGQGGGGRFGGARIRGRK
jgi:hypothetical protein